MWLEENRCNILSDNPDFSDEADIIKEGMVRFRVLSTEERKVSKDNCIENETLVNSQGFFLFFFLIGV